MSNEANLAKQVEITVMNKLVKEKRDINVYHHSEKSSHILSSNHALTRGIKPIGGDDYLHISVVSGPGYLKHHCVVDFPSFVDFAFLLSGEEITLVHSGERMLVRVPPGPPVWQVKLLIPKQLEGIELLKENYIAVGDGDEWPGALFGAV